VSSFGVPPVFPSIRAVLAASRSSDIDFHELPLIDRLVEQGEGSSYLGAAIRAEVRSGADSKPARTAVAADDPYLSLAEFRWTQAKGIRGNDLHRTLGLQWNRRKAASPKENQLNMAAAESGGRWDVGLARRSVV
jgi:hypothetical protein